MAFKIADDYVDVATRVVEFREKYPTGSLQQVSLDFREFAGKSWVIYTAAAYRTPDDERPGHGTAWEPVPGATPYTRDSELQNAETAAWGRAIVAVLAGDAKRGIASAEEIRNRSQTPQIPNENKEPLRQKMSRGVKGIPAGTRDQAPSRAESNGHITRPQSIAMHASFNELGITQKEMRLEYCKNLIGREITTSNDLTVAEASRVLDALKKDATNS